MQNRASGIDLIHSLRKDTKAVLMPMIPERRERLSRYLALLLRHQGPQSGLRFDDRGFTAIDPMIQYINRHELFRWVKMEHVQEVVQTDPKGRYEIVGNTIRAKYGHSFAVREPDEPVTPPSPLFYGISSRRIDPILHGGLRPFGRSLLHLSVDEHEAFEVARRQDPRPAMLEIDAAAAHQAGVKFFKATDKIFLTTNVPPQFVKVKQPKR
jgi:putative RNA 2'-phosphotransferase